MRVLIVSDKEFSRRLGDGLRVHGLFQHLQGSHEFHLVCFRTPAIEVDHDVARLFASVTRIDAPLAQRSSWLRRVYKAVTGADFKRVSAEMRAAVARGIDVHKPDIILDVSASSLLNLPAGPLPAPLVVDSIDEPMLRELRALSGGSLRSKAEHLYGLWRFWKYERKELARAAQNIYVSEVDALMYRRFFPDRPVAVIPNGVDIDHFSPGPAPVSTRTVAFEGNMNFAPNVDGARRLVNEILPLARRRMPALEVVLVGRDPAPEVAELAGPGVFVTGTVSDIRPHLRQAGVFACPLRLGSGIKNKVLQAWAMARPVVATSASLGGLAAQDGRNILVRDTPQGFADAIVDLIENPAMAGALGAAGRRTVEEEYSWTRQAKRLETLLDEVVHSVRDTSAGSVKPSMQPDYGIRR